MANRKISDLTALTAPATGDLLPIVDISEAAAADKNKKITLGTLLSGAPLGSAAAPSFAFSGDSNTGIYSPGADQLAISTGGTGRVFVTSTGLGVGTSSPGVKLDVQGGSIRILNQGTTSGLQIGHGTASNQFALIDLVGDATYTDFGLRIIRLSGGPNAASEIQHRGAEALRLVAIDAAPMVFATSNSERARIDSSGRLLVGTSSARSNFYGISAKVQFEAAADQTGRNTAFVYGRSIADGPLLTFAKHRADSVGGQTVVQSGDICGEVIFTGSDGTNFVPAASIRAEVDGTPGANDMPGRLVFSVTPDGGSSPTTSPSAMTINSGQEVLIGYSTDNGAYKLQVNSQIFATSATIATSDGRYKENVVTLDDCVDLVKALRPVSFDWKHQEPITRINKEGETVVVREAHNFPDGAQVGFIAQEVQEVLAEKPWLTSVIKQNIRPAVNDSDGNELAPEEEFFGIAEGNLVAVLTSALKDAIGRIESLEAEVAALKA